MAAALLIIVVANGVPGSMVVFPKRPVDIDNLEQMVSGIVRQLENRGDTIISSELIGTLIMEGLRQIDDVSYVRFASVYKDFREAKDFEEFLEEISDTNK